MSKMPFRVDPAAPVRILSAGREAEGRDPQAALSAPQGPDPGRADLRADARTRRTKCSACCAHVLTHGLDQRADDLAQVPRGDGVLRRGDGPAPRQVRRRGQRARPDPKAMGRMMMGDRDAAEQAARSPVPRPHPRAPARDRRPGRRRTRPACRRCAACPCKSARTRSSASPACPATASASWCRCWPASGRRTGGTILVHGEDYRRHPRGDSPPPLPRAAGNAAAERLRADHDDRREPRLSQLRPPRHDLGRWFVSALSIRRRAAELIERYGIRPPWHVRPHRQPVGRQRAAGRAGPRAGGGRSRPDRRQPLFRPRFSLRRRDPLADHAGPQPGAAVLLVSEDLDEILELADRILVISGGRIVHETTTGEADRQVIGRHMAGH